MRGLMLEKNKPQLSVIVVSYNSKRTIGKCLRALETQMTDQHFEAIVVDSSTDGTADLIRQKFPNVRLFTFRERKYPGDARNFGIIVARGDIIAFVDADCFAADDWVARILRAHRSPHPAIGGTVANGDPESWVGWAAYFCEFTRWMPNQNQQWLADIPTANMSYKRSVFETHGKFIEGTYCADTELHWRLGRAGIRLLFEPSILVYHQSIRDLHRFLAHEFSHGRSFARVRVRSQDFSRPRSLVYALFSFLIPLKLFGVNVVRNLRDRIYLTRFLLSAPLTFAGMICWSLGECAGYAGAFLARARE